MAKRKAEGSQRGGKAPARPPPTRQPPPPPPQDDSTDSDVCEIVKPPPSSNPPRQQPRPQPVGISSAASSRPQARVSGGFLSMMPGIPAAGFGLSAAGQGAHFGYHQASNGFNPYLFPATQLFPPQAGVQRGFFPGAPRSIPVGASSGGGGASSGASEVGESLSLSVFLNPCEEEGTNRHMCDDMMPELVPQCDTAESKAHSTFFIYSREEAAQPSRYRSSLFSCLPCS